MSSPNEILGNLVYFRSFAEKGLSEKATEHNINNLKNIKPHDVFFVETKKDLEPYLGVENRWFSGIRRWSTSDSCEKTLETIALTIYSAHQKNKLDVTTFSEILKGISELEKTYIYQRKEDKAKKIKDYYEKLLKEMSFIPAPPPPIREERKKRFTISMDKKVRDILNEMSSKTNTSKNVPGSSPHQFKHLIISSNDLKVKLKAVVKEKKQQNKNDSELFTIFEKRRSSTFTRGESRKIADTLKELPKQKNDGLKKKDKGLNKTVESVQESAGEKPPSQEITTSPSTPIIIPPKTKYSIYGFSSPKK